MEYLKECPEEEKGGQDFSIQLSQDWKVKKKQETAKATITWNTLMWSLLVPFPLCIYEYTLVWLGMSRLLKVLLGNLVLTNVTGYRKVSGFLLMASGECYHPCSAASLHYCSALPHLLGEYFSRCLIWKIPLMINISILITFSKC